MKTVLWVVGDASGDVHTAGILRALKTRGIMLHNIGIGGPNMQREGLMPLFPFHRFQVMGFVEVLRHLPFFLGVERRLKNYIYKQKPDLVVLVDYPGLNMRLAHFTDDLDIPVLWYISPQFWAWRHGRVHQLRNYTRHVACIFPFEVELLDIHRVTCSFVGHPIAEEIGEPMSRDDFAGKYMLDPAKKWIGFFPGSRNLEIHRMLPIYLEAAMKFPADQFEILLSKAPSVDSREFDFIRDHYRMPNLRVFDKDMHNMMKHCYASAVTSGTATLEAAWIGSPFVICYKAHPLSYYIGKHVIRIKRIGMPNIIMEKDVVPELIQKDANPDNLYTHLRKLVDDAAYHRSVAYELLQIRKSLGAKSASKEMADLVEDFLFKRPPKRTL